MEIAVDGQCDDTQTQPRATPHFLGVVVFALLSYFIQRVPSTMSALTEEEITDLSYRELQIECRRLNLTASGATKKLRQRLRSWCRQQQQQQQEEDNTTTSPEKERTAKRLKSVTMDLICPITMELPFEPVTAADGRVYEKSAIKKHFQSREGMELTSPMTNQPMSKHLFPAPQHKNLIQTLIDQSIITGDLAEKWHEREKEAKAMQRMLQKAKAGDAHSIYLCGENYYYGIHGFPKDREAAYGFYEKGHKAGLAIPTAMLGHMRLNGVGIEKNQGLGLMFLSIGAERGSDWACLTLGKAYVDGSYGFPKDKVEGVRWVKKALSDECPHKHIGANYKTEAKEWLAKHAKNNSSETTSS